MLRLDDIHQRENSIRDYLQLMDSLLAKVEEQSSTNSDMLGWLQKTFSLMGPHVDFPDTTLPFSADLPKTIKQTKRQFNDQRLQPFTSYPKPLQRRPSSLQRGMSVDVGELSHLRSAGGRNRHYSLSVCEDLEPTIAKSLSTMSVSDDENNLERRRTNHVCFKDVPEYMSDNADSSSPLVSSALRPRSLKMMNFMPLTPIVTPNRIDYTSITDSIDTSCVRKEHSPPNTPVQDDIGDMSQALNQNKKMRHHKHHRQHRHHDKNKPEIVVNDGLKSFEENENKQMEVQLH